jgi:hypothetical protein
MPGGHNDFRPPASPEINEVFKVESEVSTAFPSVIKGVRENVISPPTVEKNAMMLRDDVPTERGKRRMSRERDDYFELNAL